MNKKGFTLIELLAVIVILGVISSIAVLSYSQYVKMAGKNYYKTLENSMASSAREYMAENSNYYPKSVGSTLVVQGSELINSNLIDSITDENGNNFSKAVVIVKKTGSSEYTYTTCLVGTKYRTDNEICQ